MRALILEPMYVPTVITSAFLCMFIVFSYILYHGVRIAIIISEFAWDLVVKWTTWLWSVIDEYEW